MSDDRLSNLKAKLMAEKERSDAREAEQAKARAEIAAKKNATKELFEKKRTITDEVVAALNDELGETGIKLTWRTAALGPRNTELERQQVALRELGYDDSNLDKLSLYFGETGRVSMSFGTKNHHPAGRGDCALEEYDAGQLRTWILDFIETNIDHDAKMRG